MESETPPDLDDIAQRLSALAGPDILRFSECVVPGRKGYERGWITSTSPEVMRLLCDVWNARKTIAVVLASREDR